VAGLTAALKDQTSGGATGASGSAAR
jgi:hypothetical protein